MNPITTPESVANPASSDEAKPSALTPLMI